MPNNGHTPWPKHAATTLTEVQKIMKNIEHVVPVHVMSAYGGMGE
jgi:hypothetical protein